MVGCESYEISWIYTAKRIIKRGDNFPFCPKRTRWNFFFKSQNNGNSYMAEPCKKCNNLSYI